VAKYDRLSQWLTSLPTDEVSVSFAQLEEVLGFTLPESARTWMSWWENERLPVRSQCKAWARAGFQTQKLNLERQTVVFAKTEAVAKHRDGGTNVRQSSVPLSKYTEG
jgi:hypothetical protein